MNLTLLSCSLTVVFLLFSNFSLSRKLEFKDIVFIILSQKSSRHEQKALKLQNEIIKETNFSSTVYLTHIHMRHIGDWTVIPILPILWTKYKQKFTWMFICTDETKVDILRLKELLQTFSTDNLFIGRGLEDAEATIIHHFASAPDFKYPLFSSGFVIHYNLAKKIVEKIYEQNIPSKMDFSIDASYELAAFIKKNFDVSLTHSPFFCIDHKKHCATHIRNSYICDKKPVDIKKIVFAVKTCKKFHEDRVPVVQKTWGQWTYHLSFFSDSFEKKIPTVKLNVPNTERGHCAKTEAIMNEIRKITNKNKDIQWAVICDDDTIFSTYRLQELLGCYNHNEPIAIGERYGYNVHSRHGYNYITGGGGAILSKAAIKRYSEGYCKCPSATTPDDMFLLGICLLQLNISIVHSPLFHQARPIDYSKDYLLVGPPISFHKHWMVDPIEVYKNWFQLSDLLSDKKNPHVEL